LAVLLGGSSMLGIKGKVPQPPSMPLWLTMAGSGLTRHRRLDVPDYVPSIFAGLATLNSKQQDFQGVEAAVAIRVAAVFRGMLDHFFGPFALQHNRHILEVIDEQLASSRGVQGPWEAQELRAVVFGAKDLTNLDARISALLAQLPPSARACLGSLFSTKHLHSDGRDHWLLCKPPEVRRPVKVACSTSNNLEEISVLSHSVKGALQDATPSGAGRRRRLAVELREHFASIICLQGFDADADCQDLVAGLVGTWYDFCTTRSTDGEANTIFWDRRRWTRVSSYKNGSLLALDLACHTDSLQSSPLLDKSETTPPVLRVVCVRPTVEDCCATRTPWSDLDFWQLPLVVCGDFAALGGAEGAASFIPALDGLHSAAVEALGEEIASPGKVAGEAFRLRQVWRPSAVFYHGLCLTSFLCGHTEGYLSALSDYDLEEQFPAGRLPLFATFSDHKACEERPQRP